MSDGAEKPVPVWVHPSRGMEAVAAQRREALVRGAIPNGFHYQGWRQSQLWREVARKYQPAGLEAFYREIFAGLGEEGMLREARHLVALGAGGARKERWFLEEVSGRSRGRARCTPVDVSVDLALLSAREVADWASEPVRPLVADVEAMTGLKEWLGEFDGGERRWFTAFGLTPNAEPEVLLPRLRGALREGEEDRLLVSANLLPGGGLEEVRAEYDNPETRLWLREVLVDWGLASGLGELEFGREEMDGVAALVGRAAWVEDREIDWEGVRVAVRRGDWLRVFFTLRYTLEGLGRKLAEHGLEVERAWEGAGGREGVCLARRSQ